MVTGQPTSAPACPHPELARDFQPFDLAEPFDFYARARAQAPVFYSPEIDYWVVTRYDDMRGIFRDPVTFSSENTQAPYKPRPAEVPQILEAGGFSVVSGLSGKQPPDHTRLRGFIKQAFTPRRVASLEPEIRAIAARMIERFAGRGQADLVVELARELPALVIFRMLGIPDADVPQVKEWAQSRVYMNFGDRPVEEQVHHAENLVRYWRYWRDLVQSRFATPQDDLPGDLVGIYRQGDQTITTDEIAALVYGQLTAGHETTTALLSNGLKELLGQPEAWQAICRDRGVIPVAVEELLRVSAPVFTWKRRVKAPAQVGGVDLPAGTNLLLLLGSANHDDAVFENPDRIDLGRENASRQGIHFCLGAPLARLEGRVVLEELSARLPTLRLVPGQRFDYGANTSFRGPSHLLVQWDTTAPYRRHHAISEDDVRMAVVVQRMVDARAAGVAMTLDPATGDRTKVAIEASFGLGETVVSGTVTPDHFLVEKVLLEVVGSIISRKEVELVPDAAGRRVRERAVEADRQLSATLSNEEVGAVAARAKRAERHYGCPQDIEWAIDRGGAVMLLQSRPETVWSNKPQQPQARPPAATGLMSIANTLINPLAARRAPDVNH